MKNKITETLEGSLYPWSERDTNYFAQEILDILKQEGWIPPHGYDTSFGVCEICDQLNSDKMRVNGWIHKDDPVKGLKVIETCPDWDYTRGICDVPKSERDCNCTDGKISTSLTVGKALEMIDGMVEELHDVLWSISINEVSCKMSVTKALTTKDDRKVVKEG